MLLVNSISSHPTAIITYISTAMLTLSVSWCIWKPNQAHFLHVYPSTSLLLAQRYHRPRWAANSALIDSR